MIVAESADHSTVELVAKFSTGCEEKEVSLAREAIAACLACDLRLPIPEPFLVDVPTGWADGIADPAQRGAEGQLPCCIRVATNNGGTPREMDDVLRRRHAPGRPAYACSLCRIPCLHD